MDVSEIIAYWLDSAEDDWPVVTHLLASGSIIMPCSSLTCKLRNCSKLWSSRQLGSMPLVPITS